MHKTTDRVARDLTSQYHHVAYENLMGVYIPKRTLTECRRRTENNFFCFSFARAEGQKVGMSTASEPNQCELPV
jgi:hypothetical protein